MGAYGAFFALLAAIVIAVALLLVVGTQRLWSHPGSSTDRSGGTIYRDDARYWYAGVFYYNPDDPDTFVPKRFTPGFTLNFARPGSKVFLAILVVMILLPIALAVFAPGLASQGCHPTGCHLTP